MPDDKLKKIHAYLRQQDTDVPEDYSAFEEKFYKDPKISQGIHSYLSKQNTDVPEKYEEFIGGLKKKDLGTAPSSVSSSQKVNEEIPTASREELQSMLDSPDIKEKLNPDPVYQELLNKDTALTRQGGGNLQGKQEYYNPSFSKSYKEKKELAQETEQAEKVMSDAIKAVAPQGPGYDYTLSPGVNAWNSFMGGALKTFSGLPKSVGVLSKNMDWFNEYTDKEATDLATYKAGQWLEDTANELFPTNPELRENFLATTLPQAGGNMAAFIAGGAGGRAIKAGSGVTVGLLGATQTAASEYDAALQSGAAPEDAFNVFLMNLPVGAAEGVPVAKFFGRLNRVTNGAISGHFAKTGMSRFFNSATGEVVAGGLEEMTQEIGSQMASNFVAQNTYDNTRQLIEGVKEGGAAGFILGALMNGIGISLRNRLNDPSVSPEQRKEDLATIKYLEEEQAKIQSGEEILNVAPKEEELHKKKLDLEKDLAKPEVSEAVKAEIKKEVQSINQEIKAVEEARIAKDIEEGKAKHTVEALEDEKQFIEKELESKEISDQTKKVLESRVAQIEAEKKAYQPGDVVELSPEPSNKAIRESQTKNTQEGQQEEAIPNEVQNSEEVADQGSQKANKPVEQTQGEQVAGIEKANLAPQEGDSFEVKSKHTGDPIQFTYKASQWTFKDSKGKEQVESPKSQEKRTEEWREQNGFKDVEKTTTETSEPFENIEQLPESKQLDGLAILDNTKKIDATPKADTTIVPPPTSKSDIPASEGSNNLKERASMKKILESNKFSEEFKKGVSDKGKYYVPITHDATKAEVDALIDVKGIEQAKEEALNPDNKMHPSVRVKTLFRLSNRYDQMATEAEEKGDIDLANRYRDEAQKLAEERSVTGTVLGQTIDAFKEDIFEKSPSQVIYETEKEVSKKRKKTIASKEEESIKKKKKAVKEAEKEAGKEAAKSKRAKSFIDKVRGKKKEVKEKKTPDKEVKKDITRKKIEEGKAQAKAELDALFKEMSSRASSGIDPVVTAKIVKAATKYGYYTIAEGYYSFKDWSAKMKKELGDQIEPYLEDVWNEEYEGENLKKLAGEVGAYRIEKNPGKEIKANLDEKLEDIAEKHFSEVEKSKEDLVNKIVDGLELPLEQAEKLATILEEEFDKLVANKKRAMLEKTLTPKEKANPRKSKELHDEIIRQTNMGALTDEQFEKLYAEKMGLPHLSEQNKKDIIKLVNKVQKAKPGFERRAAAQDLMSYQLKLKGVSTGDIAMGIWYSSILSGPSTHALNTYANFTNIIGRLWIEFVKNPKEGAMLASNLINGLRRGYLEAKATLKTGYDPEKTSKINTPNPLEFIDFWGGKLNPYNYAKYAGRLLNASDILSYHGLKEMRAYQYAMVKAKNEGKDLPSLELRKQVYEKLWKTEEQWGQAKDQAKEEGFKGDDLKRRAYEILEANRNPEILEEAMNYALEGTFNQDPKGMMGVVVNGITRVTDVITPLKFIIPFTRIIANVTNDYAEWFPLIGYYRWAKGGVGWEKQGKQYKKFTPEERLNVFIKASTGTLGMIMLYALTDDENGLLEITGNGTGDYKKNYELSDWQEYSIRIKGTKTWFSYQNTPLAIPFSLLGYTRDAQKYKGDKSWESKLGIATFGTVKYMMDLTFLASLGDFFDAFTKEGERGADTFFRKMQKMGEKTAKSFVVPNVVTQTSRFMQEIFDQPVKRADNFLDQLRRDIPIANSDMNNLVNTLGEPVMPDISHRFLPFQAKSTEPDKVWMLLNQNNIFIGGHTKGQVEYMTGLALTDQDFYDYSKMRGELIKEAIEANYKDLVKMDKGTLSGFISQIKKLATDRAKMELFLKKKK